MTDDHELLEELLAMDAIATTPRESDLGLEDPSDALLTVLGPEVVDDDECTALLELLLPSPAPTIDIGTSVDAGPTLRPQRNQRLGSTQRIKLEQAALRRELAGLEERHRELLAHRQWRPRGSVCVSARDIGGGGITLATGWRLRAERAREASTSARGENARLRRLLLLSHNRLRHLQSALAREQVELALESERRVERVVRPVDHQRAMDLGAFDHQLLASFDERYGQLEAMLTRFGVIDKLLSYEVRVGTARSAFESCLEVAYARVLPVPVTSLRELMWQGLDESVQLGSATEAYDLVEEATETLLRTSYALRLSPTGQGAVDGRGRCVVRRFPEAHREATVAAKWLELDSRMVDGEKLVLVDESWMTVEPLGNSACAVVRGCVSLRCFPVPLRDRGLVDPMMGQEAAALQRAYHRLLLEQDTLLAWEKQITTKFHALSIHE